MSVGGDGLSGRCMGLGAGGVVMSSEGDFTGAKVVFTSAESVYTGALEEFTGARRCFTSATLSLSRKTQITKSTSREWD
ncbi:hypothetical protein H9649_17550 [Sporosarcina sp. Sa2YVA2]|uniref:Uncharacterized protein n=1 Tax=Sporosarcina quadrami TaxID=2762234 RepID=A0ABR8UEB4_9BACL|nr:hypothetical protein [Sporosarcina quadrami]MBD7986377.1 hypothetical protein [Sporosarcina quadrami]